MKRDGVTITTHSFSDGKTLSTSVKRGERLYSITGYAEMLEVVGRREARRQAELGDVL